MITSASTSRSRSRQLKLVCREQGQMNVFWKCSIILLMCAILGLTPLYMYSFRSLTVSYNLTCVANSTVHFLSQSDEIDETSTIWGLDQLCDYLNYTPFVIAVFAMFWLSMFMLCGRGGFAFNGIFRQPWQIVMPALVFFTIITIFELAYVITVDVYLTLFCNQLRKARIENTHKHCGFLIGFYSLTPANSFFSSYMIYHLINHCMRGIAAFWLIATIILAMRVFLLADFKVILTPPATGSSAIPEVYQALSEVNTSKEKLIYMNRNFAVSRSVHFKGSFD